MKKVYSKYEIGDIVIVKLYDETFNTHRDWYASIMSFNYNTKEYGIKVIYEDFVKFVKEEDISPINDKEKEKMCKQIQYLTYEMKRYERARFEIFNHLINGNEHSHFNYKESFMPLFPSDLGELVKKMNENIKKAEESFSKSEYYHERMWVSKQQEKYPNQMIVYTCNSSEDITSENKWELIDHDIDSKSLFKRIDEMQKNGQLKKYDYIIYE